MSEVLNELHEHVKKLNMLLLEREPGLSSWWQMLHDRMIKVAEYHPRGPQKPTIEWIEWILEYGSHTDNCTKHPEWPLKCECGWLQTRIEIYDIAKDISPTEADVSEPR